MDVTKEVADATLLSGSSSYYLAVEITAAASILATMVVVAMMDADAYGLSFFCSSAAADATATASSNIDDDIKTAADSGSFYLLLFL